MIPVPLRSLMELVPAGSFPEIGTAGTYLCPENGPKGCWNPGEDADGNPVPFCECISGKHSSGRTDPP